MAKPGEDGEGRMLVVVVVIGRLRLVIVSDESLSDGE